MRLRIGILAACTTLAVATSPAVAGEGWSDDEVLAAAGALAKQLAMPDEQLFGGDYDGSSVSATMGGAVRRGRQRTRAAVS